MKNMKTSHTLTGFGDERDGAPVRIVEQRGETAIVEGDDYRGNVPMARLAPNATAGHTPGPWHLGRGYSNTNATPVRGDGGFNIAWVCGLDSSLPVELTKANARLIAAAPELLDLAIWVRNKARTLQTWKLDPGGHEPSIAELAEFEARAEAVIARATGGHP